MHEVKKILNIFFLFLLVIVILYAIVFWINPDIMKQPGTEIPTGWQIIRPPHEVSAVALQGDVIWAGGIDGVVGIERKSGKIIKTLDCFPSITYVKALLVDRSDELWVGHQSGLTKYDGEKCRTYDMKDGLPDNRVNTLFEDTKGKLWVGTWGGAAVYDGNGWEVIKSEDGMIDDMVNVIFQDSDGGMWFGSYVAPRGGISIYTDGKWQKFSTTSGLPHNNINALLEDSAGNIWAGTGLIDRGGAARFSFNGSGWAIQQVLTSNDGLAADKVRSLFQDRDGIMWFGSENDGIARMENGSFRVFTEKNGLSNPEIKRIVQDADGDLWIGTRDGVTRLNYTVLGMMNGSD